VIAVFLAWGQAALLFALIAEAESTVLVVIGYLVACYLVIVGAIAGWFYGRTRI
jgi:hypothetical protein